MVSSVAKDMLSVGVFGETKPKVLVMSQTCLFGLHLRVAKVHLRPKLGKLKLMITCKYNVSLRYPSKIVYEERTHLTSTTYGSHLQP